MAIVPGPTTLLYMLIAVSILLIIFLISRPSLTASRAGKQMAFVVLFVLPVMRGVDGRRRADEPVRANPVLPVVPHYGALRAEPVHR